MTAGRHTHAATHAQSQQLRRLQRRAERAEAALADLRRDATRAILGLRRQVAYWRLRSTGASHFDAVRESGLAEPTDR